MNLVRIIHLAPNDSSVNRQDSRQSDSGVRWHGVRNPIVVFLVSIVLIVGVGCRPADPQPLSERTDETGRGVVIRGPVSSVVTLAPSLTELVIAAGGADLLVAVSTVDNLPETDNLKKVNAVPVDFEAVVQLNPDLVLLLDGVNKDSDADRLESLGISAFVLKSESLDDVIADISLVGELIGTSEVATNHASLLAQAARSVSRTATSMQDRPSVLFLVGDETLYSFGAGSYVNDIIRRAGGESITEAVDQQYPVLSEEFVLMADPDFIVGAFGEDYDPAELLRFHPAWANLRAVADGNIISLDPDIILRPGPRIVNALTILSNRLHPGETSSDVVVVE